RLETLSVPDDWQVLYFGCTFIDVPEPIGPGLVRVTGATWETHAMLLRTSLIPRLHALLGPVSRCRNRPAGLPVRDDDMALDNLMVTIHREFPVYACYPAL